MSDAALGPEPRARDARGGLGQALDEVSIELTQRCNLSCAMCAVWEGRRDGLPDAAAVSLLHESRSLGATTFTPSGAEPLMRKSTVELLEEASALGFAEIAMVTNGALVPKVAARLSRISGLRLNISIDGPRAVHDALRGDGSYDQALAGLKAAADHGIATGVSAVLMAPTLATLDHVLDLAERFQLSFASVQPFQPEIAGAGRDHGRFIFEPHARGAVSAALARFAERADRVGVAIHTRAAFSHFVPYLFDGQRPVPAGGCQMPGRFILVDVKGNTFPCFFLRRTSMGNVLGGMTLSQILRSEARLRLQLLGLSGRCGGCLAACSDIAGYRAAERGSID